MDEPEKVRLLLTKPGVAGVAKLYQPLTGKEMSPTELARLLAVFTPEPAA